MKHARSDYDPIQDPRGIIPEDEPVFLLRGQDAVAAEVVRYWARLNKENGGDLDASELAFRQADLMDAWPVKKPADLAAGKKEG